jgi:transporter family-2 protein
MNIHSIWRYYSSSYALNAFSLKELGSMKNIWVYVLLLLSGFGISIQGSVNGALGKTTGFLQAAFISFVVGTVGLFVLLLFTGKWDFSSVWTVPKWQLIGGLFGAFYITILALAVPNVGIGASVITVVLGQMLMSLIIDNYGWFNAPQIMFNSQRIIGVLLLIAGLIFINRGS